MSRLCLIAAGGTGGHMFPAQALAETLLESGWRVKLSTDARGILYADDFPDAVEREVVASGSPSRGGVPARVSAPFKLIIGIFQSLWRMRRDPPAVVVGFGGYPSVPAMVAAKILRRPSVIHEQNGVPGRVNLLLASRVRAVACGVWPTNLPEGVKGTHTGNPVRAAVLARAGAGYIGPGDYPMSIVVIGGSQGARVLSEVAPSALAALPDDIRRHIRVTHQAREEDQPAVLAKYDEAGIPADVHAFFHDIPALLAEAQLVISRAGASSIADISVIGRPSVLVPFAAAAGDHQTINARGLVEGGAAVAIAESDLTPAKLAEGVADILSRPDGAAEMAENALLLGKPDAAKLLAELVASAAGAAE